MRVALDVSRTAHAGGASGIPRVTRAICSELGRRHIGKPVIFDSSLRAWRTISSPEIRNLESERPKNRHPVRRKVEHALRQLPDLLKRRTMASALKEKPPFDAFILPEIFWEKNYRAHPRLQVHGPTVAICHDLIALQLPQYAAAETVRRFPQYIRELAGFDGVACVSQSAANDLLQYWQEHSIHARATVGVVPLGEDGILPDPNQLEQLTAPHPPNSIPIILCVGTIEGRKNHVGLLDAAESLWQRGIRFELHLAGRIHTETGQEAATRLRTLRMAGHPIIHHSQPSDADLRKLYAVCRFTVVPSLKEGFGLPVVESLRFRRPCVCTPGGSLAELASKGGCLLLDSPEPATIAKGIRKLLETPSLYDSLCEEASQRKFRTWVEYADDLLTFIKSLRNNAPSVAEPL